VTPSSCGSQESLSLSFFIYRTHTVPDRLVERMDWNNIGNMLSKCMFNPE
jgi:hypothetical protein